MRSLPKAQKSRKKAKPKPKSKPIKVEEELVVPAPKATAHAYVPKHEILSPEEARSIFSRHHARPEQFPYILISDPVVKEIGGKPGDLVRIVRRSETAGVTNYYRLVVEG